MFYANLTNNPSSLESLVKGVNKVLTPNILATILGIPYNGRQLTFCNTWPETLTSLVVLSDILDQKINYVNFFFTSSLLNLEMRVLSLVIS